jgi:hypothetical protein
VRLINFQRRIDVVVVKQRIENDEVSRKIFTVVRTTALQHLDKPPVAYVDNGAYWNGPMRQVSPMESHEVMSDTCYRFARKLKNAHRG